MAVHHHPHLVPDSLEEYFAIVNNDPEHRYEYLNGVISMIPKGSPDHAIIGNNLGRILGNLLQGRRCFVYNAAVYVELTEHTWVCPDVTVSCDPRDRRAQDAVRYPTLIVEVLSPNSEVRDRGKKSEQYRASQTIEEYLLVSIDVPRIELCCRGMNNVWTTYTLQRDEVVELNSFGISFPVIEAYRNTSLVE